ncbi:chondroitinase-B domain-containing protein [Psychroserpens ponticola]|uniref:Ig-like domain-containing protein n=1 Tax=Psychroserpens ponticola TaxID=2932268 RepID=A0ABY7RWQ7_9FLAO|nr:chondroitinase-B domain-containing protein [Psychroserpens ponticola]WCO01555.1 Ig-like domain-containing protein [Psychroserpens ponticola]
MFQKLHFCISLIVLMLFSNTTFATDYTVNSADEFNNLTLQPCDVVTWTNGTYSNQEIVFSGIGESGSPIVLKTETPGGVIFTGESKLNMYGEYLIVDGFYWNGGIGFNNHTEFRRSGSDTDFANNCILRNCAFNNLQPEDPIDEPDAKSRWIVLYGSNNTIEHCSFLNKDTTGVCILVELEYHNGNPVNHNIQNNYFYNVSPKDGRENSGDSEGIRIGSSSEQTVNASLLVEHNYFQEVDGENEIISNKSLGNTFRNNTFRNCRGSLVLRHGAQALVEGNYFLGENKENSGGIRVSDQDHIIINNYMQELDNASSIYNNGITLMGGDTASGGTSNGYQTVSNVLIAFNTIYNSDDPIHYNDEKGNNVPQGTIANNLIYSTNGNIVTGDIANIGGGMNYDGNIFGGSTIGITDPGITDTNGDFTANGELFKPSTTGPAANTASGTYNQVTLDIEGYNRPVNTKDVGAHEIIGATGIATNPIPIEDADVGNGIGVCYLNAQEMPSSSSCPLIEYGTNCAPIQVTGVEVNPEMTSLEIGNTQQLTATIIPSNATNIQVTWSSSDALIATVNTNGLVTAMSPGIITVTVTTVDGSHIDTASIEVLEPLTPPDCVQGTNLSLSANVVSYSAQQTANPASNVIDGDSGNRWSAENFPQSMVFDLGDGLNVNEINLYTYQNRDYQYLVEGSETSATSGFVTLVDRQTNTATTTVFNDTFDLTVVRYIRLTVTGAATYTGPWVSIADLEVICAGSSLSVSDHHIDNKIKVYPNPFNSEIHLDIPTDEVNTISKIKLIDITGKLIQEESIISNLMSIKFNYNLSKGLYFIQILDTNSQILYTQKMIKR